MSMSSREDRPPHDQLNFRIPVPLHKAFKIEVTKRGKTESEVIRGLIEKFVADATRPVVY